jgi:hypothetical protein
MQQWTQWNLAKQRATAAVQMHAMELRRIACAPTPARVR